jgi:hypothetical protein
MPFYTEQEQQQKEQTEYLEKEQKNYQKATKKTQRLKERQERRRPIDQATFKSSRRFGRDQGALADPSDLYANQFANFISFSSTISDTFIKFKAMLTQYEDQFSSEWNSEQVYGRSDPIQTFRNTTRTISIGWDAPAASYTEAITNMLNAAELARMLYPAYKNRGSVSTINKSPMIKVRFRNLIQGYNGEELLVTLDGINFSPDLEAGWFDKNEDREAIFSGQNEKQLVPKLLKFSCTMTVLHQTTIGHNGANNWPSSLPDFPNLPPYTTKSGINAAGAEADLLRLGAGFDAEEADAFQAALEASEFAAAGEAAQRSDRQKTRDSRKSDRQEHRAKNLEANIKEAESAAAQSWYILGGEPK